MWTRGHVRWPSALPVGLVLTVLVIAAGCGSPKGLPQTHPVTGTITLQDGGTVPAGTLLEFRAEAEPRYTTLAAIGADGHFTLYTLAGKERLEGAVAGSYQVTVVLPDSSGDVARAQKILPVVLTQTCVVKPGGPNALRIEVPRTRR